MATLYFFTAMSNTDVDVILCVCVCVCLRLDDEALYFGAYVLIRIGISESLDICRGSVRKTAAFIKKINKSKGFCLPFGFHDFKIKFRFKSDLNIKLNSLNYEITLIPQKDSSHNSGAFLLERMPCVFWLLFFFFL